MNKTKKPRIRFKGFTDDWEQRKVGEFLTVSKIPGHTGIDAKKLTVKLWGKGIIGKNDVFTGSENTKYYIRRAGQFMYGKLDFLHAAFGIVPEHLDTYESTLDSPAFDMHDIDSHFLLERVMQKNFYLHNGIIANGSRKAKRIHENIFLDMDLVVPSYIEQEKIGSIFRSLDDLITLHQRKCEKLKIIKKSMIENCFPKNGQKVPKIRFSGFTGDWEQRKLGHIVGRVTRKNKDLVSNLPLTISAQYGLIDQNEFFDKRIASKDVSNYYLIHKGEFAYNKSTSTDAPWGAIKRLDRYENGVLSTLYIIFRILDENQVDSDYLASYYNTALWYKSIRMIAAEGARNHGLLNIAPDDFFETTLMIPRDIAEQKKIGAYLKNLDDLITLHQRKLEKLKKIKKSMLERMFV